MVATWRIVALFCVLYVGTFTTNKYVLSVLRFTFPTIFQGWQTGFGLGVLLVGTALNLLKIKQLTREEIVCWSHGILFYSISIFTGSKALSVLTIPAFVAMQNTVDVFVYMFQVLKTRRIQNAAVLLSAIMVLGAAIAVYYSDVQDTGYRWMAAHIVSTSLLLVSQNWWKPASFSEMDALCYQYLFSLLLFIPGSVLLGDLTDAYYFSHWYKMKFYVGCMLSGLLGALLNIISIHLKLTDVDFLPVAMAISKSVLLVSSHHVFEADYNSDLMFTVLVSMTSYYVFLWLQPSDDGSVPFEETAVKLTKEVI